jgi:peroxiredoxin
VEQHKLDFDLLSDMGNTTAQRFGIAFKLPDALREVYGKFGVDLLKYNGDSSWSLPMPASYVVDSRGVIRYASVDPDYTVRPEPDELVRAVEALKHA